MSENTGIEWTQHTWNPWHGCHKISPGCKNCYMFTDKKRYGQDPNVVVRSKTTFNAPLKWTDPALVFTCSWSDWFIEEADEWRNDARDIILRTPHLTYQILTKRPERAVRWIPAVPDHNVWLGVSVGDRKYGLPRINVLRELPAAVRFLSIEPLLEDIGQINLDGIGWVIVGGESGPEARPMNPDWACNIRDQCVAANVPLFFKQWGEWADYTQIGAHGWTFTREKGGKRYGQLLESFDGPPLPGEYETRFPFNTADVSGPCMVRVGKKAAGRRLDRREWSQFPATGTTGDRA